MALALYEVRWKREAYGRRSWRPWCRDRWVGGRWSVLPWRRRAAHAAVLALIKAREAVIGWREDPWKPARSSPAGGVGISVQEALRRTQLLSDAIGRLERRRP